MRLLPLLFPAAFALVAAVATPARADVTSWFSVGTGAASLAWSGRPTRTTFALPVDFGVGTSPARPIIVGYGLRFTPYFGRGTEFASYARVASHGYVVGGWGVALDAGGFAHVGGGPSVGGLGTLNLGAPWGVVLAATYERGTHDVSTVSAVVAIDFLRLTVYRLSGESAWPNVNPAWRPER